MKILVVGGGGRELWLGRCTIYSTLAVIWYLPVIIGI